jgi:hypothetical protein
MGEDIVRVAKVRPAGGLALRVRFVGEQRARRHDLTGLFARSRHFAPLLKDEETFAHPTIVEDGLGIAWPVETEWGRLDLSAETLHRIAEEQQPMSGTDFAKWRAHSGSH